MDIAALDACKWLETNAAQLFRPLDAGTPQLMLAGQGTGSA
jgi:hypothetical protein